MMVKFFSTFNITLCAVFFSVYDKMAILQARGVSAANIEGKWSNPELINIEDIPPPVNIASELTSAEIVIDNDGIKSYRVTMTVNWENTIPTPETTRKRQAPVREAEMTITGYTIVIGDEQIEEPYGEIPGSSIQRAVRREGGREGGEGRGGEGRGGEGGEREREISILCAGD